MVIRQKMNAIIGAPPMEVPMPKAMAILAPNAAPDDIPRVDGEAIGLRNRACIAIPLIANPAPTVAAQIALGILMSFTT